MASPLTYTGFAPAFTGKTLQPQSMPTANQMVTGFNQYNSNINPLSSLQPQISDYTKTYPSSPNDKPIYILDQNSDTSYLTGGSSAGGSGGGSSSSGLSSYDAYIQMLMQQQALAEQRLREQMDTANAAIDRNADYAIGQMDEDRVAQQRQAYVSKEKALNSLPQASLAVGGGGLSETSLMGVNSEYENAINTLVDTFNRNKSNVLNEAANLKSTNESNLAANIMDFENQMASNMMQMAATPGIDPAMLSQMVSSLNVPTSASSSSEVARLRAQGLSDDELRALGYAV